MPTLTPTRPVTGISYGWFSLKEKPMKRRRLLPGVIPLLSAISFVKRNVTRVREGPITCKFVLLDTHFSHSRSIGTSCTTTGCPSGQQWLRFCYAQSLFSGSLIAATVDWIAERQSEQICT